jgi:CheY-like chemotaxis protein
VLASLRAGAVDQVSPADPPGVIAAAARAAELQRDRRAQRRAITSLRSMVEDFLRVLVQAERRSIDLEHRLARQERPSAPMQAVAELDGDRVPCVFVVEADRRLADELVDDLETAGLTTFAFVSGEEAIATAERMAGRAEPVDLVLCDVALPGVDGLETIRQLRRLRPSLAALLLTAAADPAVAEAAADLGVAGLVCTPLQDRDAVVARVRDHARAAMARAREQLYLARIKQRHDHVLQRYRALAADLDRATKV